MVALYTRNPEIMVGNKTILLLLILALHVSVISQDNDSIIEYVGVSVADQMPAPLDEILKFIQKEISVPCMEISDSLSRIVLISFWVDTIGCTYKHKVEKGITAELNDEALRVCRLLKFEKPAYSNGVPVEIQYTLPVDFSSSNNRKRPERRSLNK